MQYLFDSNILIYQLNGSLNERGNTFLEDGLVGEGAYSIVSKIELLGFQQPKLAEAQARELLASLIEISLSLEVAEQAIKIRKAHKIKLPDAIVAATALVDGLRLVTRNIRDFTQIDGLLMVNPYEVP
ncbi:MAG: type II toxin-antitoxin system VapC family toxin [Timaviella obliquedivisa GSE-PSE-MK23-08B]|jgi:hypothetical protein|nr:type II toxin-antitoxin system VapC family toxin [Timaviella obliquedivisa GSE-PSE-MK23-08B]